MPRPFATHSDELMAWPTQSVEHVPRLLIVDDEPVNIHSLYPLFADDYEVFMATSGQEALAMCHQNQPDLVLLDVLMPDMDGLEVCRQLKAESDTAAIPVIFVTSQHSPEEESAALAAGAVDFISKPVNPAVVKARVKTHLTLKWQADTLRNLASMDGLTGVPNRRVLDDRLRAEWRSCLRNRKALSLLMIDVDQFKSYNDHYGHLQGDECLKAIAKTLSQNVERSRDVLARFGGEEFVCLLPETDHAGAMHMAERLRQAIESLAIPHEKSTVADVVTVSLGLATQIPLEDSEGLPLLMAADEQLYRAKQHGRNRVMSACDKMN